jgi:hypothetical protein
MIWMKRNKVPNWVLEARVHTELGRLVPQPRKLHVKARAGVVNLHGTIPTKQAPALISAVKAIPGVSRVVSELSDAPAARERWPRAPAKLPRPAASFLLGLTGGALVFSGAGLVAHSLAGKLTGARK